MRAGSAADFRKRAVASSGRPGAAGGRKSHGGEPRPSGPRDERVTRPPEKSDCQAGAPPANGSMAVSSSHLSRAERVFFIVGSRGRGDAAHERRVAAAMAQARAAALRRATVSSRRRSCDGEGWMAGELDGACLGCSVGGRASVMEPWRRERGAGRSRGAIAGHRRLTRVESRT